MRRKHRAIIAIYAIAIAVLLPTSFVREVSALNDSDLLTLQIKAASIKGESIDQILDRLSGDYEIRIGIELGDEKRTPDRKIDLDLPETSLKHFLDSMFAKDPRYTWKLEGGVVHVWPVSERDTLLATLLDTKISHFSIIGEVLRNRIYDDVMDLPEIRSQMVIAGVEPLTFNGPGSWGKLRKETFFSESNLTLRELLDRIVLKTEIRQWIIGRWGKNSEYISLKD